jgi:tRNA1(Val) A37 N6-methylase TrmN6
MALIFSRLAHNFVKAGYFPTDEATLERIAAMLQLPATGHVRMIDPCCGEGTALAEVRQLLAAARPDAATSTTEAFGIELDPERAWHAKTLLDRALHTDVHDAVVKPRSMGLLFLNPPYGYGVSDKAGQRELQAEPEKAERLERTFLRKTVPYLAHGGVLVYIVPHYALDDEIRAYLVRNFENLKVFMSPERRFKQCVIVGTKCKPGYAAKGTQQPLIDAQASEEGAPLLPEVWLDAPYLLPAVQSDQEVDFHAVRIDEAQLSHELIKYQHATLWCGLQGHFSQARGLCRPPLRDLTPWHLALALAAGQVVGKIQSAGGRTLLIKGDTFKRKERHVSVDVDDKGNASQTTVMLDRFVPAINAIELTPDHRLGQIVKIA